MPSRLIVGAGYLGKRLAEAWQAQGDTVFAVTRSAEKAALFESEGLIPVVADVTRSKTLGRLPTVDTLVFCVAYDRQSHESPYQVYAEGMRNVLLSPAGESACIVHISSTGVYGDHAGEWTDECSPTRPVRQSAKALLEAENILRSSPAGPRSIVLRLAGIYGPGRIPLLRNLIQDLVLPGEAEAVVNLIHVDDAVTAVLLASQDASRPNVFNVSDGQPVTRADFYRELARLLNLPVPRFDNPSQEGASEGSERSFNKGATRGTGHKRVSNHKICRELGFSCRYPSYREGLAAVVRADLAGETLQDRV
ncbi:SDR family oxidoreductase [Thermopirellula anaerolimosa]